MICLDANYLIGGVSPSRVESARLLSWAKAGETFCTAAPTCYEFLCGPVSPIQIEAMRALLTGGVLPFDEGVSEEAARLFNAIHRPRQQRVDVMIAATAIQHQVPLATSNVKDFGRWFLMGFGWLRFRGRSTCSGGRVGSLVRGL